MAQNLIFLSYSRTDSAFATDLAEKLRASGANVWMDQSGIKPSMHWDNTIEQALDDCQSLLVLLSEHSVRSENVKDEYSYAIEQGKQVLPVLLEDCEIPFRLKRLQYIDFSTDPKKGLSDLLEWLHIDKSKSATVLKAPVKKPRTASQQAIQKARKKSKAAYVVLLFVFVVVVFGVIFREQLFPNKKPGSFTVVVQGASEIEESSLPENGLVILEAGELRMEQPVNSAFEATFRDIPASLFNEQIGASLVFQDPDKEPYRALFPDSVYTLQRDGSVKVTVKLFGLDRMQGIVKDFENGDPLKDVRVSVNGEDTFTDANGEFSLSLPEAKQKKFQTVRAFLEGYQMFELSNVPVQTGMELPILMKPKSD